MFSSSNLERHSAACDFHNTPFTWFDSMLMVQVDRYSLYSGERDTNDDPINLCNEQKATHLRVYAAKCECVGLNMTSSKMENPAS